MPLVGSHETLIQYTIQLYLARTIQAWEAGEDPFTTLETKLSIAALFHPAEPVIPPTVELGYN